MKRMVSLDVESDDDESDRIAYKTISNVDLGLAASYGSQK